MAISIESLSVSRGGVNLLQGVDIELKNGQAGILRGPNGVGKTTLLRALAGLQPVESGTIKCSLEDICYSGHADGVKPTLTVQENLEFWANIFGSPSISEVAEKFMITDLLNSKVGNLSAGQKRRVGLARLGLTGRQIWLLDEPTVSLDETSVKIFGNIIFNAVDKIVILMILLINTIVLIFFRIFTAGAKTAVLVFFINFLMINLFMT